MAKCEICGKRHRSGHTRSHSNIATKRKFKANLQTRRVDGKKTTVCTRCIKTTTKTNA